MPKTVQHPEILVQARRGGTVESLHRACAALAAPDGEIVERWGDPGMVTFWRSSAKPLQAQAWVVDGTVRRFGWGTEELAIMSASHEGLDVHADLVRRMLADIGLGEQDLRCDTALKARHNCSGNHTGFLAACVHHGWDVASYQRPEHPSQQAALAAFAALIGRDAGEVATGVDGCGIVCYATPVTVAASTFALLPELLPEISAAMRAHPELIEGPGAIDTEVMRAVPGATSKCGAEGLSCFSLPDGRGLAVKVVDGADRAHEPAGLAALEAVLGPDAMSDELRRLARPPLTNDAGDVVGELLAFIPE
ncbi:MAG: asparaginase [Actinobacteria bacterium]|nr:asparaginase [Actinomycetota bacterium]